MGRPLGLVIPIHNGEPRLDATLTNLAQQAIETIELQVVAVINATTDGSETTARGHESAFAARGIDYRVIAADAGRAAALNAAEHVLAPSHRVYLDQDVLLGPGSLAALVDALDDDTSCEFVVPQLILPDLRSRLSLQYYRALTALPYASRAPISMGVYGVSHHGRQRWGAFPAIHSDDKFARLHFAPSERSLVRRATYSVALPDGPREIIRARTRYTRGNRELARTFPDLARRDDIRTSGLWSDLLSRPTDWPDAAVFGTLYGLGSLRAMSARP